MTDLNRLNFDGNFPSARIEPILENDPVLGKALLDKDQNRKGPKAFRGNRDYRANKNELEALQSEKLTGRYFDYIEKNWPGTMSVTVQKVAELLRGVERQNDSAMRWGRYPDQGYYSETRFYVEETRPRFSWFPGLFQIKEWTPITQAENAAQLVNAGRRILARTQSFQRRGVHSSVWEGGGSAPEKVFDSLVALGYYLRTSGKTMTEEAFRSDERYRREHPPGYSSDPRM